MTTLDCRTCNQDLPVTAFYPTTTKRGYCLDCKPCLIMRKRMERRARRYVQTGRTKTNDRHGLSGHPLYATWKAMLGRCYSEVHPKYHAYGARGITVHEPWHNIREFVAWVEEHLGDRPPHYTLDRIDNDRGYEPGNVRWANAHTQRTNQRTAKDFEGFSRS